MTVDDNVYKKSCGILEYFLVRFVNMMIFQDLFARNNPKPVITPQKWFDVWSTKSWWKYLLWFFLEEHATAGCRRYCRSSRTSFFNNPSFALGSEYPWRLACNEQFKIHRPWTWFRLGPRLPLNLHLRYFKSWRKNVERSHPCRRQWTSLFILCK